MYLVSPTGEEKEKQSMKRKKEKSKQFQGDIAEVEASVEAIQGLRQRLAYMWDDPPGSPSTFMYCPWWIWCYC